MAEARRRGPVPRISRAAVLDVAREMPPEDATLSAIGAKLGVTGPALYRYFPDRTAILQELAHEAREQAVPPPADLPWEEWLLAAARSERELWKSHANLYEVAQYRAITRPLVNTLRIGMEVMRNVGFSEMDALCGLTAVTELAHTIGYAEANRAELRDPDTHAEILELVSGVEPPVNPDAVFERVIAITINGLRPLRRTGRRTKRSQESA